MISQRGMAGWGERVPGSVATYQQLLRGTSGLKFFPIAPKKKSQWDHCLAVSACSAQGLFWRSPNTGMLSQPSGTPSPSHLLCPGTLPCSSAPPQPQGAQEGICSAPYLLPSSCSAHLHPRGHPKGNGAKHPATGNGPDPATPKGFTCSCLCCSLCSLPTEAQQQHCLCSW